MNTNNYIHSNLEIKKYFGEDELDLINPPEPRFYNDPLLTDWRVFISNIDSIQSNYGIFSTIKTASGVFPNSDSSLKALQPNETYYFIVNPKAVLPIKIPIKNNFKKSILISNSLKSKLAELNIPKSYLSQILQLQELSYETVIDALQKDIDTLRQNKKYEDKLYQANILLKALYEEYESNHPCSQTQPYSTNSCGTLYQLSKSGNYNFNPTINLPSGITNNLTEIKINSENQYLVRINIPLNNIPLIKNNEEITFAFNLLDSDYNYTIYPSGGNLYPVNNEANISAILNLMPITTTS